MSTDIPGYARRREGREEALGLLYQAELLGTSVDELVDQRGLSVSDYAVMVSQGVAASRTEVDQVLSRHLTNWTVDRMPIVDRVLARIAVWELLSRPDIPTGVVLSEAVELAGQYANEQSPRFLNGVLSEVARDVRG